MGMVSFRIIMILKGQSVRNCVHHQTMRLKHIDFFELSETRALRPQINCNRSAETMLERHRDGRERPESVVLQAIPAIATHPPRTVLVAKLHEA